MQVVALRSERVCSRDNTAKLVAATWLASCLYARILQCLVAGVVSGWCPGDYGPTSGSIRWGICYIILLPW